MLIRGKPKASIRESLEAYLADAGYRGPPRLFLVTERGYGYAAATLSPARPSLAFRLLTQFLAGRLALMRLALPANKFRVKNNVRVYFDAPGGGGPRITAKIAVPARHRTGTLEQEIRIRKLLEDGVCDRLAIPAIVRHDETGFGWLEEEFVDADKRASVPEKVGIFLDDIAASIYRPHLGSETIGEALPSMGLTVDEFDAIFDALGLDRRMLERRLTTGFVHGDLSPANMMLGRDDRLYLIDWELAEFAPVAWDLKKLFSYEQPGVLEALERIRSENEMSAAQQMQIALCCQLAILRRDREARLSYLTSNRNKSMGVARDMVAKQDRELEQWIRQLAPR